MSLKLQRRRERCIGKIHIQGFIYRGTLWHTHRSLWAMDKKSPVVCSSHFFVTPGNFKLHADADQLPNQMTRTDRVRMPDE
jgi:hypothetical protein